MIAQILERHLNGQMPHEHGDFSGQIARAFGLAPLVGYDPEARMVITAPETTEPFERRLRDWSLYNRWPSRRSVAPNCAATTNPNLFAGLLRQATQVLTLHNDGTPELTPAYETLVGKWFRHEMEHVEAAHGAIAIQYQIVVNRDRANGRYLMNPEVVPYGIFRKVEFANILAAPSDPSPGDESFIRRLGYASPEEVRERAAAYGLQTPSLHL